MSINNLVFTGNCGRDMEIRHTATGKVVGSFSVPMKQGWGENEKTNWVECSVWGDRASNLASYITKGTAVTVQGELGVSTWEDKATGAEKWKLTCTVSQISFGQSAKPVDSAEYMHRTPVPQASFAPQVEAPAPIPAPVANNADIWGEPPF